ncbi:hypothetical protein L596_030485 [Steinernema carpocapsae]|uniref:Uncharacterized protein n=1 Tax=Steinernema carpocapsae TaxID=34508 RepID=A0A4U5LPK3_STECR|nr:hypothetical protein L596_030485 [Steinernema carpocapsae]
MYLLSSLLLTCVFHVLVEANVPSKRFFSIDQLVPLGYGPVSHISSPNEPDQRVGYEDSHEQIHDLGEEENQDHLGQLETSRVSRTGIEGFEDSQGKIQHVGHRPLAEHLMHLESRRFPTTGSDFPSGLNDSPAGSLYADLNPEEESFRNVNKAIKGILNMAGGVFPPAKYLGQVIGFMLDHVHAKPDSEHEKLKKQIERFSEEMNFGFTKVEHLINDQNFKLQVLNPSKAVTYSINTFVREQEKEARKRDLEHTCINVKPCVVLDILYNNFIKESGQNYINTYLDSTKYGHQEFVNFRSALVNTTTSLMISCTFCEKQQDKMTYSVVDLNIEHGRNYANRILEDLTQGYEKQKNGYFRKIESFVRPIIESKIQHNGNHKKAAKELCEAVMQKYSIEDHTQWRPDNFVCIVHYYASNNKRTYFIHRIKHDDERLIDIEIKGRHFIIYRVSQSQAQFEKNINLLIKVKDTYPEWFYQKKEIDRGLNYAWYIYNLKSSVKKIGEFPFILYYYQGLPEYKDTFGVYGGDEPLNGNRRAGEHYSIPGLACEYFGPLIRYNCRVVQDEFNIVFGL